MQSGERYERVGYGDGYTIFDRQERCYLEDYSENRRTIDARVRKLNAPTTRQEAPRADSPPRMQCGECGWSGTTDEVRETIDGDECPNCGDYHKLATRQEDPS